MLLFLADSSEVVQLLLDAGAQINIKDTSDCPLHLAEDLERLHIVELIKKHMINED
jgi:ankyrin repeat protein